MYKKVLAASALSLALVDAHAQSSVTLSGIIDSGISYKSGANAANNSQWAFGSGNLVTSRFILSGVEDLGGGTQALFRLESGFLSGTGAMTNARLPATAGSYLFDRGAWVGLKQANLGQLSFGRHYTPFVEVLYQSDASGFENFASVANTIYQTLTGFTGVQYTWANNSVKYTSPTFYGLTASALESFGGVAGDFENQRVRSAALYYTLGPFSLNGGYIDGNDPTGLTNKTVARAYTVFADYTLSKFRGSLNFMNFKNPATGSSQDYYSVGAQYRITPAVQLVADYTYLSDRVNSDRNGYFYKLGVHYFLSKSTNVYSEAGLSHNNALGTTGVASVFPSAPGLKQRSVVVGMEHFF
ncbi:porin [Paraburkholderia pallida]|uniref:Porin n=1 Tax=Paraburkholderia pallida TaxID=2547399 RepID=A0A4P7D576_9BURK|nr:porin [Paraburkholderia pallida]QBR01925.1 porin [Paraburkholderia pallida]